MTQILYYWAGKNSATDLTNSEQLEAKVLGVLQAYSGLLDDCSSYVCFAGPKDKSVPRYLNDFINESVAELPNQYSSNSSLFVAGARYVLPHRDFTGQEFEMLDKMMKVFDMYRIRI